MKILIIGASGFIGKHLVRAIKIHHSITVLLQFESDKLSIPSDVKSIIYDKSNVSNIEECIRKEKISGIIHLASLFLKDHKLDQIRELIDSNILLGTQILEIASKSGVKWFINTGTFWQHYNNEDYNPVNLYAATKQAFENIGKYYIETSDIKFVTLKLNDTFGPNDTRPKIFSLWDKISKSDETLDMSPGNQIIDISYIDNITAAYEKLIEILESDGTDINGKSFALYSENRLTLKELARLFEKFTNRKLKINWGGKPYREREVMEPWKSGDSIPDFKNIISLEKSIQSFLGK